MSNNDWSLERRHQELIAVLEKIEGLANAPHWTSNRRWQIAEAASAALEMDKQKA